MSTSNHSMSRASNYSATNYSRYRQPRQVYEHDDVPLFPHLLSFGPTQNAHAVDNWLPIQDRAMAEPFGSPRIPDTLHSPVRILAVNNVMARHLNLGSRRLMFEASPRFNSLQHMPIRPAQDESMLTQDEQKEALEKLKKDIYNPMPKKIAQRISLYYRDYHNNAKNSSTEKLKQREDEDDKSCAICLEDFEPRQEVMLTPCTHMFHEVCIVPWVKSNGRCPVCRFAMCGRIRDSAAASNNNNANVTGVDPLANEVMSLVRSMEEAFTFRS